MLSVFANLAYREKGIVMFILRRLSRLNRTLQFALIAVAAFAIGSATVAVAAPAGIPIGSLFYLPVLNGVASTPCSTTPGTLGTSTTCTAVVDSKGQLATSDADTHKSLSRLQYDSSGNLKVTSQGSSTVTGHVNVDNLPSTQTVHVDNVPATQNVNVVGGSAAAAPAATRGVVLDGTIGTNRSVTKPINLKATWMSITGCSAYRFYLSGGTATDIFVIDKAGTYTFPIAMDVTEVTIMNDDSLNGCLFFLNLVGY